MKDCRKCKRQLPLEAFNRCARKSDGRSSYCRECASATLKEWKQANSERVRTNTAAWRAANRERRRRYKAQWRLDHLEDERARDRARYRQNPEPARAAAARRAAANPEAARARARAWAAANRTRHTEHGRLRKARLSAVLAIPFTPEELDARMAYWGHHCWMCGGPQEAVDHVKPIKAGGAHILANLRPACKSCNSSKGARWPVASIVLA